MQPRRPLSFKTMSADAPADSAEMEALRRKAYLSPDPTFSVRLSDPRLTQSERIVLLGIGNRIWGK